MLSRPPPAKSPGADSAHSTPLSRSATARSSPPARRRTSSSSSSSSSRSSPVAAPIMPRRASDAPSPARPEAKTSRLPKCWPSTVTFVTRNVLCPSLTPADLAALSPPSPSPSPPLPTHPQPSGPNPLVRIAPITAPSHPAHGQHGLFATTRLAPDALVTLYLGEVRGSGPAVPPRAVSDYEVAVERDAGLAVDAARVGNEARFVNDFRGVRGAPNAEFRDCWVRRGGGGGSAGRLQRGVAVHVVSAGRGGLRAKGIARGEEIVVSYGKGFWRGRAPAEEWDSEAVEAYDVTGG